MWCLISQSNSVVFEVRVDPKSIGQECLEKVRIFISTVNYFFKIYIYILNVLFQKYFFVYAEFKHIEGLSFLYDDKKIHFLDINRYFKVSTNENTILLLIWVYRLEKILLSFCAIIFFK